MMTSAAYGSLWQAKIESVARHSANIRMAVSFFFVGLYFQNLIVSAVQLPLVQLWLIMAYEA